MTDARPRSKIEDVAVRFRAMVKMRDIALAKGPPTEHAKTFLDQILDRKVFTDRQMIYMAVLAYGLDSTEGEDWDITLPRVVTLRSPAGTVLRPRIEPCPHCPWRKDALGKSPKEVFAVGKSRETPNTFGCHMSGVDEGGNATLICAGFLASQESNLNHAVAFARSMDSLPDCHQIKCDVPLYETYDEMAVAHLTHEESK